MGLSRPALHSGHRNRSHWIAMADAANTIPPAQPRTGYRSDPGNRKCKKRPDKPARQPLTTPTIRTMSRRMSRRSRSILDRDFAMGNSLSLEIEFCQPASFTCEQNPPRSSLPTPAPAFNSGAVTARSEPGPLASVGGTVSVIAWSRNRNAGPPAIRGTGSYGASGVSRRRRGD